MIKIRIHTFVQLTCLLLFVVQSFSNPVGNLGGDQIQFPFGTCQLYRLGGNDFPFTHAVPLHDGSQLAFFPMTDAATALYIHITLADNVMLKVIVDGSVFKLEKCDRLGRYCATEDEGGVKHLNYIKPHEWNLVRVSLNPQQMIIYIGQRMVKTMSMLNYNKNLEEIRWAVFVNQESKSTKTSGQANTLYLVQFRCKEYTRESPAPPHHEPKPAYTTPSPNGNWPLYTTKPNYLEYTTNDYYYASSPEPHEGHDDKHKNNNAYIGIIVGVVIGTIVVIVVALIIYNVVKKRKSAKISEQTHLKDKDQHQQEAK